MRDEHRVANARGLSRARTLPPWPARFTIGIATPPMENLRTAAGLSIVGRLGRRIDGDRLLPVLSVRWHDAVPNIL